MFRTEKIMDVENEFNNLSLKKWKQLDFKNCIYYINLIFFNIKFSCLIKSSKKIPVCLVLVYEEESLKEFMFFWKLAAWYAKSFVLILTVLEASALLLVVNRWTRHILLNIAPKANVKPRVSNHDVVPHATGNKAGLTNRPSNPKGMMAKRHRMIPTNMRLLQDGWDCLMIFLEIIYRLE